MSGYNHIKEYAEDILRENGCEDIQWVGPVDKFSSWGLPVTVIAVWFKILDKQYFTPFSSPWNSWTGREVVDKHIAEWIRRVPGDVDCFLDTYPELKFVRVAKCVCGAHKTSNPNCHSRWCSAYDKE